MIKSQKTLQLFQYCGSAEILFRRKQLNFCRVFNSKQLFRLPIIMKMVCRSFLKQNRTHLKVCMFTSVCRKLNRSKLFPCKFMNFRKHGIHFSTAVKVFLDPFKMIREYEEHRTEERYNVLGKVGKVLFVVCAFKQENTVRIISARLAAVPEKERYEYGEDEF